MKVGDKLYCKEDYYSLGNSKYLRFEVGNYYPIDKVSVPESEDDWTEIYYSIKSPHSDGVIWFVEEEDAVYPCLWDYFYTEKEMRKMKLEEING